MGLFQFLQQPCAGVRPKPCGGTFRHSERVRRVLAAETGEETQLDQLGGGFVLLFEFRQGLIDREQLVAFGFDRELNLSPIDARELPAAFLAHFSARAVDQNPAHRLGGGGKEMISPLPFLVLVLDQSEISLVNQGGGLQGLAGTFLGHPPGCQAAQFVVHDGEEFVGSVQIASLDGVQQPGYLIEARVSHSFS